MTVGMLTVSSLTGLFDLPSVKPDAGGGSEVFAPLMAGLLGPEIKTDCTSLPPGGETVPVAAPMMALSPDALTTPSILVATRPPAPSVPDAPTIRPPAPSTTVTLAPPPARFAPIVLPAAMPLILPRTADEALPPAAALGEPRPLPIATRTTLLTSAAPTLPIVEIAAPIEPSTRRSASSPPAETTARPIASSRMVADAAAGPVATDETIPPPAKAVGSSPVPDAVALPVTADVTPYGAGILVAEAAPPPPAGDAVALTPSRALLNPVSIWSRSPAHPVVAQPSAVAKPAERPAALDDTTTVRAGADADPPRSPPIGDLLEHRALNRDRPFPLRPELVEGPLLDPQAIRSRPEERRVDKLSTNGSDTTLDALTTVSVLPRSDPGQAPRAPIPAAIAARVGTPPAAAPSPVTHPTATIVDATAPTPAAARVAVPPLSPIRPETTSAIVAAPVAQAPVPAAVPIPIVGAPATVDAMRPALGKASVEPIALSSPTHERAASAPAAPQAPAPQATVPVILPALQAFGAAIRRALADERKPAPPNSETSLGLTALAGTTAPATTQSVIQRDATLDTADRRWPHAMAAQIEKLRDAVDAQSTRIRLLPDALGPVDVAVRRDGEQVHVHFTAAQAETRQLLADAQPRLADAAEARGVKLGRTDVSGGDQTPADRQHQQRAPAQTPHPARPAATRPRAAPTDASDTRLA